MRRMLSLPRFALSILLVSATAIAQNATTPVRIVNPIDEHQLLTLKGTVHPLANKANDRGAVADSMQLDRMHLVLKRSNAQEAALKRLITDMHTPGSANYHKWLTPDAFGKQFGPADEDVQAVQTWLTGHGFTVSKVNPGKQTIEFSGNVKQFKSAFHAEIHKYQVNGETRYANSANPQIPAALAQVVGGFVSLNNFRMKSFARVMGKASYNPKTDKATASWTYGTSAGVDFVLSPGDYAVQYDLNPLYSAGLKGAGQSIAIIDYSNINVGLVNQFRTLFGLPVNPPQVIVDGNDPGIDGINDPEGPAFGTSVESYLDVEWAGAVAPLATIDLIVAADTQLESGGFLAAERAVYGNVAPILSSSIYQYGCEQEAGSGNQFIASLWEQAAAQGITVLEAAGDSGSAGCDSDSEDDSYQGLGVNNWASTPWNLAVGGTDFYYSDYANPTQLDSQLNTYWNSSPTQSPAVSLLQYIPEQPWNDSQYGLDAVNYDIAVGDTTIGGGSGGASNCATGTDDEGSGWTTCTAGWPKPAWQTGTGVPADGVRDLPDVSLFAADGLNYSYYPICAADGDCQTPTGSDLVQITGVGGTSAAAPSFAGIMALVEEKYGSAQGQAGFVLYPLKAQYPASFHDILQGTNSVPCEFGVTNCIAVTDPLTDSNGNTEGQMGTGTTPDYNAAAGYNLATGLGTVDAAQLVDNWNKITFAAATTTLTPSSTSFTHGTAITISGGVTGTGSTPTGDVALMTDSTEQLQQGQGLFTLSGGSFSSNTVSYLPGGKYNIWGRYGGDTKNASSTSTPVAIDVTPEASGINFNLLENDGGGAQIDPSGTTAIPYGTELTLSAQPAPASVLATFIGCFNGSITTGCPSFGYPTGTITFSDGSTVLGTALINAEGEAELTPQAGFSAGSHSVTASYSGDDSYNASTAAAITFSVVQTSPYVFVTSPSPNYTQGQASTLNVAVDSGGEIGAAPTGTVTITGAPAGTPTTATLSAGLDAVYEIPMGTATVVIPASAPKGTYNISATYNPTGSSVANYGSASTTSTYTLQITAASGIATTTTATASATGTSPNAAVVVSGTVKAASGAAPTGTMYALFSAIDQTTGSSTTEYYVASTQLTPGSGTSSTYSFALTSQVLPVGANQLTIQYVGSTTDASSSALVSIANPLSDFQLTPATTIVPIASGASGGSGSVVVNLQSTNGFAGAVSLTCTATGVTCTIPASETLTSGGFATATLKVSAASTVTNGNYNVVVTGTDSTKEFVHTLGITANVSGAVTPTFALSNSGPITVTAGATTGNTSTVSVTPSNGFTGSVALSCAVTTAPASAVSPVTCSVAPTSASVTGTTAVTATLTGASTSTTTAGAYVITVTGKSGSITQTTTANVTVNAAPTPTFALSNSGAITVAAGATTGNTSTVSITPSNGFTGTVALSCAVTTSPASAVSPVTCSVPASESVTGTTAVTATLTAASTSTTTAGAYVITVTGTSGSITQTTTANVTVTAATSPATFALSNSGAITVAAGATTGNTSTVSITPSNGFTGTVALTCAVTTSPASAVSPVTCTVPTSESVTGTTAVTATLTAASTSTTTAGAYVITVTGTSGSITQTTTANVTVTAASSGTGTFALSNSGDITIAPGAATGNTSTITVKPSDGFTGTVTLGCAFTTNAATDPAYCSISPASVDITSGNGTAMLTISTTASTSSIRHVRKLFWPTSGGVAVAFLLFFTVPRRRRNWAAMVGLLVVFVALAGMGCGGGSGGSGGGGTTAGTYSVTVTGTSGSASETTKVSVVVN
jgi:trimeric autotransporter adhesin